MMNRMRFHANFASMKTALLSACCCVAAALPLLAETKEVVDVGPHHRSWAASKRDDGTTAIVWKGFAVCASRLEIRSNEEKSADDVYCADGKRIFDRYFRSRAFVATPHLRNPRG